MALNLGNICLLPPQDLLSGYSLSQPVAIKVHQALAQFQQALSLENSLQANTINAALQQLTPVEVIPLAKEFSTGTNLKYQQVQEFDRYMEVQHVKSEESAKLIVTSLFRAYLVFLEISIGLTFNPNIASIKSGFKTYSFLLRRSFGLDEYDSINNIDDIQNSTNYHTNFNIETHPNLSPLYIWKKGHWVFLVFTQALIISLNSLLAAIANDQLDRAKVDLETTTELMYASGAAMKLTGNFTREKYESEIRPTMTIGNPQSLVQSENLSGLMMWDHDYLINIICKQKLLPILKTLPSILALEHEKFVQAYKWGISDGHKSICAEFGGGEIGSLIAASESSAAIRTLEKFEHSRVKLLDPMGLVKDSCPLINLDSESKDFSAKDSIIGINSPQDAKKMTLEKESLELLQEALARLEEGFHTLPKFDRSPNLDAMRTVLLEVAERMQDNYPYPHPLYVGQMLKPPTEIARLAYTLSLWINPNNHALDGGRASSAMEKEAVAEIAKMFGWETHLGHLSSGGTMANLEALWVAGNLQPNKKVVASTQSHYTHSRICGVLRIPFQSVPCDSRARMDVAALKQLLKEDDIGTVVVSIGTTATGSIDPLPEILELQAEYGFRIHADTAYGGYFMLVDNLDAEARAAFDCLKQVDSIVVDPHKHGLQPYGCGCILFKDPSVGKLYKHDSPYTYFSSEELHLGEISLECSRAGSSAVALWATQRLLPLIPGGEFAGYLSKSRTAALTLFEKLQNDSRFIVAFPPQLDIVVWVVKSQSASESSRLAKEIFKAAAEENLHLALANLPKELFLETGEGINWDQESITCLRSCLMKPEHLDWIDRIWQTLDSATNKILM